MTFLKPHVAGAERAAEEQYAFQCDLMVADIRAMAYEVGDHAAMAIPESVLAAMAKVPRHRFVPEHEVSRAYYNHPLPIGHGQTISQPYIVALMTALLGLEPRHAVLEVGTGSGYQAAVLAELAGRVYTMEIVEPLAVQAEKVLHELGYANVEVRVGDGNHGWPEHAPFDAIIVAAAAKHVPPSLPEQLKPGGRMAIPVGEWPYAQTLILITKDLDGAIHRENILPVSFVPLVGGRK